MNLEIRKFIEFNKLKPIDMSKPRYLFPAIAMVNVNYEPEGELWFTKCCIERNEKYERWELYFQDDKGYPISIVQDRATLDDISQDFQFKMVGEQGNLKIVGEMPKYGDILPDSYMTILIHAI